MASPEHRRMQRYLLRKLVSLVVDNETDESSRWDNPTLADPYIQRAVEMRLDRLAKKLADMSGEAE